MDNLRAFIKLLSFVFFTLTACAIYLMVYGVLYLLNLPFEPLRNRFMRFWSRITAFIFRIKVHKIGDAPEPPFILVSNHLSYLDIVPLYQTLKCTFVAKMEVRNWPVLGYLVYMMGVIFVNRKSKKDVVRVNQLMVDSMNAYQGIVIFPEGTSSGGAGVLPFRSSLLEVAAENRFPVYAASIQYATSEKDPPASNSVCFYGARHTFVQHLFLMAKNRRIDCTIRFDPVPVFDTDRKKLTDLLHQKTKNIFNPTHSL